ncbi:MAG: hypothetical protein ACK4UN_08760 [Limisphaerales bacterium]
MITVILHNPLGEPEACDRNYDAPEPFVFPNPAPPDDMDFSLSCLSIIRVRKGDLTSMKIVLRNHVAE